jgi:hypothetical protein
MVQMERRLLIPAVVLSLVVVVSLLVTTPEPAGLLLLGVALATAATVTRRMRHKVTSQPAAPVHAPTRD